jgi:cell division protein FtsZ
VVTKPFDFEGVRKMKVAEAGIDALVEHVDSLIVVLNQKLFDVMDEDASLQDAFKQADNVLHNAVAGIAEIINVPGLVNVDFADVRTVMAEQGKAMMGIGEAAGMDRARIAAEQAVASPLLDGVDLNGARGVIVNITAAQNLKLRETNEVINTIREFCSDDATIIHGTVFDDNMGDSLRVTVVATGIGRNRIIAKPPVLVSSPIAMPRTGTYDAPLSSGLASQHSIQPSSAQPSSLQPASPAPSSTSAFSSPSLPSPGFQAGIATPPTQAAAQATAVNMQAAAQQAATGYSANLDTPTVWRDPRAAASARVAALEESGVEKLDIPAFLRRQAD